MIPGLYWEARRWSSKPTTEISPGNVPPGLAQGLDGADDVRWSLTGPDGSCARGTAADSAPSTVRVPDAVTWNPESPALYDLLMEMRDDDGARTAGAPGEVTHTPLRGIRGGPAGAFLGGTVTGIPSTAPAPPERPAIGA